MNNFTNKPNLIETIGRGFRASLNGAAILDTPPTKDNKVNRRAGRTTIAIGFVFFGGLIGLASNAEKTTCEDIQLSEMPSPDPHQAAANIVTALNATEISDAYDRIVSDFIYPTDGKVPGTEICGTDAIIQVRRMIEQEFDTHNNQPFGN